MASMKDHWIGPFLEALQATGVVSAACRAAGVSPSTVSYRRKHDVDFEAAFDEAMEIAVDTAEEELWRRAVKGYDEPLTHQGRISWRVREVFDADGQVVGREVERDADGRPIPETVRKHSDALLMFLLKGRRKKVFAERTELTGAGGDPLTLDDTKRAARVAALLAAAESRKKADADMQQAIHDLGDIV